MLCVLHGTMLHAICQNAVDHADAVLLMAYMSMLCGANILLVWACHHRNTRRDSS